MRVRHGLTVLGLALIWPPSPGAADVFRLPAQGEITHAEVFIRPAGKKAPSAVVVLCPGQNGSAEDWLHQPDWQAFAERHNLALAGLYFQSRDEDLQNGRGYFVASRGAGKLLEEALSRAGLGHLPIFLYGFSGGAHFAASYAAWHPEKVLGFCAYSFGWWKAPPAGSSSPALIVCGQADGTRYGATFAYFQAGRRQGKPWAWVSLARKNHQDRVDRDDVCCNMLAWININNIYPSPIVKQSVSLLQCSFPICVHNPWWQIFPEDISAATVERYCLGKLIGGWD